MKRIIAAGICLFLAGTAVAQKHTDTKKRSSNKSGIAGIIQNAHKEPIQGVRAFVYKKDSIVSSGYTDDAGYYETGYTLPGTYDLKLVFPPSDKIMLLTGVPIKNRNMTQIDYKGITPTGDTTINYATLVPSNPKPIKGHKE